MKKLVVLLALSFNFSCSNDINFIVGKYEREAMFTGSIGLVRFEFNKNKTVTNWVYSSSSPRKFHLYQINFGKWKLKDNWIRIENDSIYEYYTNYYDKLDAILRKISKDSLNSFNCKSKNETKRKSYHEFDTYYLLVARDTSQSILLLENEHGPLNEWGEFKKINGEFLNNLD
jgi:hypothetical protein